MAIVYNVRNKVLGNAQTVVQSLETDTIESFTSEGFTGSQTFGATSNMTAESNCSGIEAIMAMGTTNISGRVTQEFDGFTVYRTNASTSIRSFESERSWPEATLSVMGRTTIEVAAATSRTVNSQGDVFQEVGNSFSTVDSFDQDEDFASDMPSVEGSELVTSSITIEVDTSTTGSLGVGIVVGTIIGSQTTTVSTTVGTVLTLATSTTFQSIYDTVISTIGDRAVDVCAIVYDTVYQAGECEAWLFYQGVGAPQFASNRESIIFTISPEIVITENESEGESGTTQSSGETVITTTYSAKMTTALANVIQAGAILGGVVQKAESSGPAAPVGTTYSIILPGSVTNVQERALRELGHTTVRQLGAVTLVNTINDEDLLLIVGTPESSTFLINGGGYPDVGFATVTIQAGGIDLTAVAGGESSSERQLNPSEQTFAAAIGVAYAGNPVLAFVSTTGSFTNDLAIALKDCCATTLLIS
jgi:hypothetical protein